MKPSLAFLLLTLVGCDIEPGDDTKFNEDFRLEFPLRSGKQISAETFNGDVEITGWDQERVEIQGTKFAREREMLRDLRPDVTEGPDKVGIRFSRPKTWGWNRGGGVRLRIRAPRSTRIEPAATTNGKVRIEDIQGQVNAKSTNGGIGLRSVTGAAEVRTTNGRVTVAQFTGPLKAYSTNGSISAEGVISRLEAETTNGGIDVDTARMDPASESKLETTNGGVRLRLREGRAAPVTVRTTNGPVAVELPGGVAAKLRARTSTGSISSTFPVEHGLDRRRKSLDAEIGGGGPLIDLRTTNGSIRLDKH